MTTSVSRVIYQLLWFLHGLGDKLINKEPGKEI
jgi:hypothetical protein